MHRFPQEAVLRDERRVMLRQFTEKDVDALYEFFHHLSADYRRFAWDQIDNRSLIESWGREIAYPVPLSISGYVYILARGALRGRLQRTHDDVGGRCSHSSEGHESAAVDCVRSHPDAAR